MNGLQTVAWRNCINVREAAFSGVISASVTDQCQRLALLRRGATTAVFAKIDVTFGDDVSGVGGKAGMRVSW